MLYPLWGVWRPILKERLQNKEVNVKIGHPHASLPAIPDQIPIRQIGLANAPNPPILPGGKEKMGIISQKRESNPKQQKSQSACASPSSGPQNLRIREPLAVSLVRSSGALSNRKSMCPNDKREINSILFVENWLGVSDGAMNDFPPKPRPELQRFSGLILDFEFNVETLQDTLEYLLAGASLQLASGYGFFSDLPTRKLTCN